MEFRLLTLRQGKIPEISSFIIPNTETFFMNLFSKVITIGFAFTTMLTSAVVSNLSSVSAQTSLVPLKLYWSPQRGDNFTTGTTKGEQDALAAGYTFARVEGYAFTKQVAGTVPLKLY